MEASELIGRAPYEPPMTPQDFEVWNAFGMVSQNEVVTMPLRTLGKMFEAARQQARRALQHQGEDDRG